MNDAPRSHTRSLFSVFKDTVARIYDKKTVTGIVGVDTFLILFFYRGRQSGQATVGPKPNLVSEPAPEKVPRVYEFENRVEHLPVCLLSKHTIDKDTGKNYHD